MRTQRSTICTLQAKPPWSGIKERERERERKKCLLQVCLPPCWLVLVKTAAVADPVFEWGPGAVTRLKCEHDKWCDREAITRGRSPRFSRGVRGHAPPENFENRDAQICVFSPFGSIFEPEERQQVVVLNCDKIKKSNSSLRFSWTFLRLWKPTYLLWASHWLGVAFSRRTPLRAYLFFEVFLIYGGRNVNDVEEFQRRWNPFSFYPIWKLSLHSTRARPRWFENARWLIDGLVSWEENFTGVSSPGAKPDKVARCQRWLHAHERRKLNFFWSEVYCPGRSWAWSWSCSIYLEMTFPASLSIDLSVPNVLLYLLVFS